MSFLLGSDHTCPTLCFGVDGGTLLERRRAYGTRAVQRKYADLSAEPCILSNRQNTIQVPLDSKKTKVFPWSFWCRWGDLNPHRFLHTPLKRARLPFRHTDIHY